MENAKVSTSPSLTKTIIVAGSCALTAVVLLAGLIVAPRSAAALPTYAEKENKPCGYCHVNPQGGRVLNATGRQYEANGRTFKK